MLRRVLRQCVLFLREKESLLEGFSTVSFGGQEKVSKPDNTDMAAMLLLTVSLLVAGSMTAGVHAGQDEGYRFIRSITVSNLDEPVTVPEGYFWKVQGLEADRPEGIGTADLYLDGEISLGNPMVDEDWVTIHGRLELTIQRRQEAAIWIRGSSVVAVGDSRQDVEFLEFTYGSAGGPGTAKLTSMVDLVDYVGTYPCSTGLLKESVLLRALERALGGDYGAYREHMQASGCGAIERKEGLLLMDVSQSGVGGYSSLIFVRLGDGAMYVFWLRGIVSDRKWKIYGSPPIPVAVVKTVVDQMNTKWGHVASFRARGEQVEINMRVKPVR